MTKNQKNKVARSVQIDRSIRDAQRGIAKAKRALKAALRVKIRFISKLEAAVK